MFDCLVVMVSVMGMFPRTVRESEGVVKVCLEAANESQSTYGIVVNTEEGNATGKSA